MESIRKVIFACLEETYDYDSICVYHIEFKNPEQTWWRAEVEAYVDMEDGPYFFIFERKDNKIHCWVNQSRSLNNALPHRGAEIPTEKRSTMQIENFIRRPFDVRAVQVTPQNAAEVAEWCGGTVGKAKYKLLGSFDTELDTVVVPGSGVSQGKTFVAKIGSWVVELDGSFRVYRKRQMQEMFIKRNDETPQWFHVGDLVEDKDGDQGKVVKVEQILVDSPALGHVLYSREELTRVQEYSDKTMEIIKEQTRVAAIVPGLDEINSMRASEETHQAITQAFESQQGDLDEPQVIDEIAGIKVGDMIRVTEEMNQFFSQEGTVVGFLNDNCLRTNMLMPNGEVHEVNHLRSEVELEEETKWVVVNNESSGQNGWVGWVVKDAPVGELVRVAFRSVNFDNNVNDRCFSYMRHELEDVSHQDLVAMGGVPSYEI